MEGAKPLLANKFLGMQMMLAPSPHFEYREDPRLLHSQGVLWFKEKISQQGLADAEGEQRQAMKI